MTSQCKKRVRPGHARTTFLIALLALAAAGCTLTPKGLREESAALAAAGAEFRRGSKAEDLPAPAGGDDWRGYLRRALVANGDVRASWFEWKAALAEVDGASEWPNTSLSLGYSRSFSNDAVKSFDRNTFSLATDSTQNLSFPGKTMAAGRAAFAKARASGERFRAAKFSVQRRAMDAWLDLALAAEKQRLAGQRAALAGVATDAADAALRAGAGQGEALSARIDAARTDDEAAGAGSEMAAARAMLAAAAAIESPRDVAVPTRLPSPRLLPADPAVLERAVRESPMSLELQHERSERRAELDLAELEWIPDINPTAMVTGSMEQAVGLAVMLPTRFASIRSGIASAKAMRSAAAARLAQAGRNQLGELRATLAAAADAARARRLLEERILPAALAAGAASESAYGAGRMEMTDVVEARLLVVEVRVEIAEAAILREKQLAALEELLGADLEALSGGPVTRFASATPSPLESPR